MHWIWEKIKMFMEICLRSKSGEISSLIESKVYLLTVDLPFFFRELDEKS